MKMGLNYTKEYSEFNVYAPTRYDIKVLIYERYDSVVRTSFPMRKNSQGLFNVTIHKDLKNKYYTYLVENKYEITDPYSISSSVNSIKTAIIDLDETNPEKFKEHKIKKMDWRDAILYELHVKDYSGDISSNTTDAHRGKLLGIIEESFRDSIATGLDHLTDLGITHVHLMPVFDFITVDERNEYFFDDDNYNWGYDPELFNTIEGSYVTNPLCAKCRVIEFKQLIMKLHERGIGVIMDVVYNHTYKSIDSNFNVLYPNYYYRLNNNHTFSNGSGTGNEFRTESKWGRKFILDSLIYYMTEYKIDGFRFDLMGLIDLTTTYQIVEKLRQINPDVIIYGEPWMASDSPLPFQERTLHGTQRGKKFSFFNDVYRDAIRGDNDGTRKGYVQGEEYLKNAIERGIAGSIYFDEYHEGSYEEPGESINYFNSHDNLIIYDKLNITMPKEDVIHANKMCFNLIMMSQGIPFFHAGNEFLRTKNGNHNSYNAPLSINAINWENKIQNYDYYKYVKELIAFRKSYREFNLKDPDLVRQKLYFMDRLPQTIIGYLLKRESSVLLVFHNIGHHYEVSLNEIQIFFQRIHLPKDIIQMKLVFGPGGREDLLYQEDLQFITIERLSSMVFEIWTQ